jgi:hypothetical protein
VLLRDLDHRRGVGLPQDHHHLLLAEPALAHPPWLLEGAIVPSFSRSENPRAGQGDLTYGSAGNGSSGHLAGELLKSSAGIDVLHVPYKGGAPAITDLLGERLSLMPINPLEVNAHAQAGRLRVLAVGSDTRFPLLPDAPTVSEAGIPGFEATVWWGLVAPAKTPVDIVVKLNAETNRALQDPTIAKKLTDLGVVTTPGSPEDFGRFIGKQTELWSTVIKKAGIRPDWVSLGLVAGAPWRHWPAAGPGRRTHAIVTRACAPARRW